MCTIAAALETAQKARNATPVAALEIEGVDQTADLVGYTYREHALTPARSTLWLDNTDGALNDSPPPPSATRSTSNAVSKLPASNISPSCPVSTSKAIPTTKASSPSPVLMPGENSILTAPTQITPGWHPTAKPPPTLST